MESIIISLLFVAGVGVPLSLHTTVYGECVANQNLVNQEGDDPISESQGLAEEAQQGFRDEPCLWLRGLLPAGKIVIPPEELLSPPSGRDRVFWQQHSSSQV